ncbi:hypothetical protein T02_6828 [Trichinella nativa]|uniref:Uncharacterized protein n=1 Tax=Trichinella nativa TaxID=6335 RepID=A0A0V1L0V3_9BILA|nr:hypothetical protein T02_6828 [Trichinella nativa]KRZ52986.1 hypothetical protein T02_6828 [Trichinella nativa]KRZ52987.1 hypothetical protein T02_6828 [Trichinella nativa]
MMNIWPVVELDLIHIPKTALLIVILSFSGCLLEAEKFITCYCNNHDKCENGRCRDESCLVGIDRSGKVVRTCYSLQPAELLLSKCSRWSGKWHEVCSCRYKHYCNSFAHFRRLFRTSALGVVHGDQQEIRGDSGRVLQVSTLYSPPAEVELDDFSLQSVQQPMGRVPLPAAYVKQLNSKKVTTSGQYTAATLCFVFILIMVPALVAGALLWFVCYSYCN